MFAAQLHAYTPAGASLGYLPEPLNWQASAVFGDNGALTISYSTLAARGDAISRPMDQGLTVAVEVWNGTTWVEPKSCRYVRVAQGRDVADDQEVYTVTFKSVGWLLTKAILTGGTFTDGRRGFDSPKAGPLLSTILAENAAADGVPVALIGGGTSDAGGDAWPVLPAQFFEYGQDYLGILRGLQEAGALDWTTQAMGLYAYLPDSADLSPDLSAVVSLDLGSDIGQAPADETIETLVSTVAVRAQAGGTASVTEPTAPTPYGAWQGYLAVGQVDNQSAAEAVGQAELDRVGRVRQQYTRDLILHDDAPIPGLAYWPGCWITAPTSSTAGERVRVQSLTLTFGPDGYGGNIVLNDRFLEKDIRQGRTLSTLAVGQIGSGGAPSPIAVDPEASRIPSTPTGLDTVAGLTFIGPTPRGLVTATWLPVSTATDSGALAIAGYELQWRVGSGQWQTVRTPEVSATVRDLTPGDVVTTRVRAVGARTTLPSAYSTTDTVTVPGDVTPPPVPTGLSISTARGIVSITWPGTPTMPADLDRLEVAIDATTTPTTVVGSLRKAGEFLHPDTVGQVRRARVRSVDTTGNASAWSAVLGPVTVASVVAADIDAAVNDAISEALTGPVDGDRLTPWTIGPEKLLIGIGDELLVNPGFEAGTTEPWWPYVGSVTLAISNTAHSGAHSMSVTVPDGGGTTFNTVASMIFNSPDNPYVRVGDHLHMSIWVRLVAGSVSLRSSIAVRDATGLFLEGAFPTYQALTIGVWTQITADFEVTNPAAAFAGIGIATINASGATFLVDDASLRRRTTGELIVDGGVTTRTLAFGAATGDKIAVGALDFKTAQGMQLIAPDIKTGTSGARVEINPTGSFWYNSAGTQTISIVGGTATITGGTLTGALVRTAASGGRAFMGSLAGGGGFWTADAAGTSRASMQVSGTVNPGLYLWDSAGTTRVFLYTSGTESVMSFRTPANTEVLKISDGRMQIFNGGQYVAYYPSGTGAASLGPIYNTIGGALLGYGALVQDWDGQELLDIRSGTSAGAGAQARVSARGDADLWLWVFDSGEAHFGSDDGSVWVEAGNVSGNGIIQLRAGAGNQAIEFVAQSNVLVAYAQDNGFVVNIRQSASGGEPAYFSSGGRLIRNASSRRYKTDIEAHQVDTTSLLGLQAVSYRGIEEESDAGRHVGLIAEDLNDVGLSEFVIYEADGTPQGLRYELLTVGLLQALQEHAARLDALDGGQQVMRRAMAVAGTVSGDVINIPPDIPLAVPSPRPADGPPPTSGIGLPAGARPVSESGPIAGATKPDQENP